MARFYIADKSGQAFEGLSLAGAPIPTGRFVPPDLIHMVVPAFGAFAWVTSDRWAAGEIASILRSRYGRDVEVRLVPERK